MRIGVDATWARLTGSGTASYTAGLVRALAAKQEDDLVLYFAPEDVNVNPLWALTGPHITRRVTAHRPQPIRSLGAIGRAANRDGLDLFHSPGYFLPLWNGPKVVSFHDANMVLQMRRRWVRGSRFDTASLAAQAALSARLARRVVTLTQSAAADIQRVFRLAPGSLAVVYPGIDDAFFAAAPPDVDGVRERFGLDRYILGLGEIVAQKNVEALVRAFSMLEQDNVSLALAGRPNETYLQDRLTPLIQRLGVARRVHFLGVVPQETLPALYAGAEAFAFPSFSEGFGLPVVEAMAAGTPVTASNRSSIPEIAGGAALLIDPENPVELAEALDHLLTDRALRESLTLRGRRNAARFRWKTAAERMTDVYRSAVEDWNG